MLRLVFRPENRASDRTGPGPRFNIFKNFTPPRPFFFEIVAFFADFDINSPHDQSYAFPAKNYDFGRPWT